MIYLKNKLTLSLALSMAVAFTASAGDQSTAKNWNNNFDIIGGENVAATDAIARRTVGLFFQLKDGQQAVCTGAIIDASHVLTAAHCVENFAAGYVVFNNKDMIATIRNRKVAPNLIGRITTAKMLPGYDSEEAWGEFVDLGIITFDGGLPEGYEAAHFLPTTTVLSSFFRHMSMVLAGYGITAKNPEEGESSGVGTLRKVDVFYSAIGEMKENFQVENENHIACHGDSGGPAMIEKNGDIFVVGIASRSDCVESSIYTLVGQDTIKKLGL